MEKNMIYIYIYIKEGKEKQNLVQPSRKQPKFLLIWKRNYRKNKIRKRIFSEA